MAKKTSKKKNTSKQQDNPILLQTVAARRTALKREKKMRRVGSVLNLARRHVRNRNILLTERQIFVLIAKSLVSMNALNNDGITVSKKILFVIFLTVF